MFIKNMLLVIIIQLIHYICAKSIGMDVSTMSVSEKIKYDGYDAETHIIITSDGYILNVHRVLKKSKCDLSKKNPIYLQHGFLSSSYAWISLGPQRALAYMLADNCYDVWIGNSRGNVYSKKHKTLKESQSQFWNFSFEEMANYDLPPTFDYILNKTERNQLIFIGHSQGCASFIAYCTEQYECNNKIEKFIGLAPAVYLNNTNWTLLHTAAHMEKMGTFKFITIFFGYFDIGSNAIEITNSLHRLCKMNFISKAICALKFETSTNETCNDCINSLHFDKHFPAGSSTKQLRHIAQQINSGIFSKYNYGSHKNKKIYGKAYPPKYNISNMNVPTYLFYGDNDEIIVMKDVVHLSKEISNFQKITGVNCSHFDFTAGSTADKNIYPLIMNVL